MALAFADEGMNLALADVDEKGLAHTKEQIEKKGLKASAMRVDVSKGADVDAFAASVKEVHVVCNNAGVSPVGPLWENTPPTGNGRSASISGA
jgi:3-oxoacyl-[acyl-carrier protein] reductase